MSALVEWPHNRALKSEVKKKLLGLSYSLQPGRKKEQRDRAPGHSPGHDAMGNFGWVGNKVAVAPPLLYS
jgi:hypothetical protein